MTYHLQDVHDRVVNVAMLFLVRLNAHDDDHVARPCQAPRGVLRGYEYLNDTMLKQPLHDSLVLLVQGFVVVADTMLRRLLQPGVGHVLRMRLQVVQETRRSVIRVAMRDDVIRSEPTLTKGRNKDDDRLVRGILEDCKICLLAWTWRS